MKRLVDYLRPYFGRMTVGLIIKSIGTLMDLAIPYLLAYIIDHVIAKNDMTEVLMFGGLMIVSSLIAVTFNIISNRMASRVACDCILNIRHDLFAKISYLSSKQVDDFTVASLESRLTSDTYNVHHLVGMIQRLGVRAPLLLIGGIAVTLTLDPALTLVMLVTLPFIGFVTVLISKKGVPLFKRVQEKTDGYTRVVRDDASGIRVIKALSKTEYEKERFDRANRDAIAVEKRAGLTMAISNPLITFILNAGLTAVIIFGAYRVNNGLSGTGTIIAFMSYFTIIANAIISVSRLFVVYSRGSASMGRIDEVLSSEPELWVKDDGGENTEIGSPNNKTPYIEFRNVSFAYTGKNVLTNISFKLYKGQTLGIIGSVGSGKSTVISLLMRFYDVTEGEILINGVNIKNIPTKKLRRQFGVIFQNDFLFADTIKENIVFGRDSVTDEKLEKALEMSQAKSFVSAYDDGISHKLEIKGANLSGGQKQRLLIARALAENPDILILDDSSSALDYKTDALLRKAIAENFVNTTCITVAQRISSVMNSDIIMMLEFGKILAIGTHGELSAKCTEYNEIANSQMGGMLVD